jgi:PAS domain S-box-containing protein
MALSADETARLAQFSVDHAMDAVLWSDPEGRILYANESAGRVLRRAAGALLASTMFEIAPELNADLWRELWKEIRVRGSFAFEFTLKGDEGRAVQVEMTVYQFQIETREIACVFFRDVQDRKRLQNLQQEFVSTVSHELRTPMTVIREGVSQVMEGLRGDINDLQRRALTIALTGIDRLGRLIDELLDVSKIESGKVTLRLERVDLSALVREIAATYQTLADERHLYLRVTTPAGPIVVYADRDRIIQVLNNLLSNAFKFTEKGLVELAVSSCDGDVQCLVRDSGIGLPLEDLERLFNKFEQLGRTAVTGEKGTGLGLSISRGIVDLHKGRIWAESDGPGKGVRILFTLPRMNARGVFREQAAEALKAVAQRGGSFSIVRFEILGASEEQSAVPLMDGLENLVRKHGARKSDLFIKDDEAMYLGLASTVRQEATRIAERIRDAFHEANSKGPRSWKLQMSYTLTEFPGDAKDPEAFLQVALGKDDA